MDLDEALSRLAADDLGEPEASELRARIASEPEVAKQYAEMVQLVAELEALPEELPMPVHRSSSLMWAGWAVAAAAALLLIWPRNGVPEVIQAPDETVYDGSFAVQAADRDIAIDGRVGIRVEPPTTGMRVPRQEERPMRAMSHAAAAVAGALLTVTVYEGTAVITGPDAQPVTLASGQTKTYGGVAESTTSGGRSTESDDMTTARIQQLEGELARLEQQLGEERFAKVLMQGQLEAERGVPTEWPEQLDARMGPEGFASEVEALVAELPHHELVETDCAEYPCLGALRYTGPEQDEQRFARELHDKLSAWADDVLQGEVALAMSQMVEDGDNGRNSVTVFGAHDEGRDSNTGRRTVGRMEDLGRDLMQE